MKKYFTKISFALVCCIFMAVSTVAAEGYKDTQGYKDYLKLPDKYKSPVMEAMYKNAYDAEQKVKSLPAVKGGTIQQFLNKKASVPAVEDLGWTTRPYQKGFEVERMLLLGTMKLIYRWNVDSKGRVKAVNGKAIGITKSIAPSVIVGQTVIYHGNIKSHIFHQPDCRYYNCKNCTAIFNTRERAIAAGYRPCKICNP